MKNIKLSRVTFLALGITAASLAATQTHAADVNAGKAKSAMCVSCHGPEGISMVDIYPNLAGQKEKYLLDSMKQYKNGKRENPIMKPMMAALSDADMANLAAFYASLGK
jgi:cytochrome c553